MAPEAVIKRRLWIGLASILAGAVWAYAQTQGPTFSLWDLDSPRRSQRRKRARALLPLRRPRNPPADELDQQMSGPQIWRLPPSAAAVQPRRRRRCRYRRWSRFPRHRRKRNRRCRTCPPRCPASCPPASDSRSSPTPTKSGTAVSTWAWTARRATARTSTSTSVFTPNARPKTTSSRSAWTTTGRPPKRSPRPTASTSTGGWSGCFAESRWSLFAHETVEYDEFQSFNVLDTSDAGVGYRAIKNDNTTLIGRFGAGFSHEYGGPENGQYIPEVVFGLQLEQQISKRQKFVGIAEYAADVGEFRRYRLRTQAAWDITLDQEKNLNLRIGCSGPLQ